MFSRQPLEEVGGSRRRHNEIGMASSIVSTLFPLAARGMLVVNHPKRITTTKALLTKEGVHTGSDGNDPSLTSKQE